MSLLEFIGSLVPVVALFPFLGASIDDVFGSSYLKASDLIVNGQRRRASVEIESVQVREFDDGVRKLELRFRGKEKGLVCNKTNAALIAEQHGEDFETWVGKKIKLFASKTEFQGARVDCVRVYVPEEAPPPPPENEDDWDDIPFN